MSTQPHLEKTLQQDIDRIRGKVMEMAGRAERALKDGLQALVEGNRQRAYAIILRDQYIDELEKEIDRLCLEFLVRQQPVAGHLRFAYATIVNGENASMPIWPVFSAYNRSALIWSRRVLTLSSTAMVARARSAF